MLSRVASSPSPTRPAQEGGLGLGQPVADFGQRVNTNVTVSGADGGKQDCNSAPSATRSVVVENDSNKDPKWG